jgi:hypothetical protein
VRTVRKPPKWSFPLGRRRAQRLDRVATTSISYVRENSESNGLIGGVSQRFRRSCAVPHRFPLCSRASPPTD